MALVSHELRTRLTAIHGGARILRSKLDLDSATRTELLDDVVAESERLERLLINLLALTEITAGRLRARSSRSSLTASASVFPRRWPVASKTHAFVTSTAPNLPPADADPALVEGVLHNLYENAFKYSPAGCAIRTSLRTEADMIVLRVTDEAVGIAPDDVAVDFKRFRRVGSHATVRGMGLGLYLCRSLVEAQGGSI